MDDAADRGAFSEMLDRAKAGDESAWEALFARLGNEREEEGAAILAIARRALPRDHWARHLVESRDIVQSALRVGWVHMEAFQGTTEAEFFAWLRTILRNKVHRATRRRDTRTAQLPDGAEEGATGSPGEEDSSPLTSLIEQEVRERILSGLESLPENQRIVMELSLEGLPTAEIARLLDLKPATVRKRESRAIERLRELLEPGPPPE